MGCSALAGFFCWRATNLRRAITPVPTTILFLLTTAALHVHMYEEHSALFGPAMSRLFGIAFPDERFMQIFVFAHYFPGMYTAILPMIPGICAVWWMFRNRNTSLREGEARRSR